MRNVPAALYKALGGFATNGVNMTKLESYMVGGAFVGAQFYVDIEGHPDERPVRLALEELGFFSREVKILGVYPAAPNRSARESAAVPRSIRGTSASAFEKPARDRNPCAAAEACRPRAIGEAPRG